MRGAHRSAPELALAAICTLTITAHAREVTLEIGDLQTAAVTAQAIKARMSGPNLEAVVVDVGKLTAAGRTWQKTRLSCPKLELTQQRVACSHAVLDTGEKLPLSFSYAFATREVLAELRSAPDEVWRVAGRLRGKQVTAEVKIDSARLTRLSPWLPADLPKLKGGRANGTIALEGNTVKARLNVDALSFADAAGLQAGENIAFTIDGDAVNSADAWRWNTRLTWRGGEAFWHPFFMAAKGHRLELQGTTARGITQIRNGSLDLPGIGTVGFTAEWNHAKGALVSLEARTKRLRVGGLYNEILKPLLEGTALSDLRAEGEASFAVDVTGTELSAANVELAGVSFEDRQRRFGVFGLSGRIPWQREGETKGELVMKGGEFLKLPVGTTRVPLRLRRMRVDIGDMRVPLLDGALVLRDFAAGKASDGWRWRFSGRLEPVSMAQLTGTLGLPLMHGSLSGNIPEVRYRRGTLAMDGALDIRVFDGSVTVSKLQLMEPFGRVPRLHADVEMKNLDLDLLTRAFDFGNITGRIDARVRGLELVGWEPVRFDARIESSPGNYPRRISQRAVENISALGGAGAAAAIQRSFLRFFENFGYQRLGLSCRLENGVCEMDGIERAPQGYVIVKGGGIPAISVIGYNRAVDWRELTERLKRITQENVKPIVK